MEKSGFFNSTKVIGQTGVYSPTYNADDFSRLYRKTIGNGVLFDDAINDVINSDGEVNGDLVDDLKVSASGNNIIIAEGTAILQGYWYNNDAELQVVTGVTPSESFMIALVLDITTREIKATKTTWTSGTPAVPEGNENNYVLPLATVSVSSGGAVTVTDVRQFVTNSMKIVNEINKSLISKVNLLEHSINDINNKLPFYIDFIEYNTVFVGRDAVTALILDKLRGYYKSHIYLINVECSLGMRKNEKLLYSSRYRLVTESSEQQTVDGNDVLMDYEVSNVYNIHDCFLFNSEEGFDSIKIYLGNYSQHLFFVPSGGNDSQINVTLIGFGRAE